MRSNTKDSRPCVRLRYNLLKTPKKLSFQIIVSILQKRRFLWRNDKRCFPNLGTKKNETYTTYNLNAICLVFWRFSSIFSLYIESQKDARFFLKFHFTWILESKGFFEGQLKKPSDELRIEMTWFFFSHCKQKKSQTYCHLRHVLLEGEISEKNSNYHFSVCLST